MEISKWRKYLNDILIPEFENSLGVVKPKVLDIGQSTTWDYRPFFRDSEFIVSDINENCINGATIDDITNTKFKADFFDGIIFNGVFEQIKSDIGAEGIYVYSREEIITCALDNIINILQKGGLLLFGAPGIAFPRYGKDRDTGRRLLSARQGINLIDKVFNIVEVKAFYGEKGLQYIYIIAQKK